MKTWLSLAASAVLVLSMAGCNGSDGKDGVNGAQGVQGIQGAAGENATTSASTSRDDFGKKWEDKLYIESEKYFGFDGAKKEGFSTDVDRIDADEAKDTILLADGLTATYNAPKNQDRLVA